MGTLPRSSCFLSFALAHILIYVTKPDGSMSSELTTGTPTAGSDPPAID